MLVLWDQKLVILATPKTGTTAIEAALGPLAAVSVTHPPALKHTDARQWQAHLKPYLHAVSGEEFEAIALMREPLEWLGSWYRFTRRDYAETQNEARGPQSFAEFIEGYLSTPTATFSDVGSQSAFLTDDAGNLAVDRVFRYEQINDFVAFLEDRLDFYIELPSLNVSPEFDLDLSDSLRARLKDALAKEYAIYDAIG